MSPRFDIFHIKLLYVSTQTLPPGSLPWIHAGVLCAFSSSAWLYAPFVSRLPGLPLLPWASFTPAVTPLETNTSIRMFVYVQVCWVPALSNSRCWLKKTMKGVSLWGRERRPNWAEVTWGSFLEKTMVIIWFDTIFCLLIVTLLPVF